MMICSCCDVPSTEEKLYQCESNGCRLGNNVYCKPCGDTAHRRMNHKFMEHVQYEWQYDNSHESDDDDAQKSEILSLRNQNQSVISNVTASYWTTAVGCGIAGTGILSDVISKPGPAALATASIIPHAAAAAMFATCAYSLVSSYKTKPKSRSLSRDPREEAERMAMDMFQFHENDLNNNQRFNAQIIKKRYNRLAKYYHPDRKHGDYGTFIRLDVSQRILLSMANPDECKFPYHDAYKLCCHDDTICMGTRKAIEYPMQNQEIKLDQNKNSEVQGSRFSVGRFFKRPLY